MIKTVSEEIRNISVCFTGHRFLAESELNEIHIRTEKEITEAWKHGYRYFYSGGAIGYDILAAETVISLRNRLNGIKLYIAIPCADQSRNWKKKDTERYISILDKADEVIVLSPKYYQGCMMARNRFMVNHSSLCICYLKYIQGGGTVSTVNYALHSDITVKNIAMGWPEEE